MKNIIHVILSLVTILAFSACASTRIAEDPFVFKKATFKPMDKSKIKKIEIVLGKDRLLHYTGIVLLPERLSITSDVLLAAVIKRLEPEEERKFDEVCNEPLGTFESYVDFYDADDQRLGTVFIYEGGTKDYEFDKLIEEIKQNTSRKKAPNKAVEPTTMRVTDPADAGSAPRMVAAHF